VPKRYTGPPGWGLGMRLISSSHKNYSFKILAVREAIAEKWTKSV
jgi:hypothetical protein